MFNGLLHFRWIKNGFLILTITIFSSYTISDTIVFLSTFFENWLIHRRALRCRLSGIILFIFLAKYQALRITSVWLYLVKPTCCKVRDPNILILCWTTKFPLLWGMFQGRYYLENIKFKCVIKLKIKNNTFS